MKPNFFKGHLVRRLNDLSGSLFTLNDDIACPDTAIVFPIKFSDEIGNNKKITRKKKAEMMISLNEELLNKISSITQDRVYRLHLGYFRATNNCWYGTLVTELSSYDLDLTSYCQVTMKELISQIGPERDISYKVYCNPLRYVEVTLTEGESIRSVVIHILINWELCTNWGGPDQKKLKKDDVRKLLKQLVDPLV